MAYLNAYEETFKMIPDNLGPLEWY
jgi:hypothetical protein